MSRIYLFDGTDLSAWTKTDGTPAEWSVEDGVMTVNHTGNIVSKEVFGDAHIHVEWREPDMPDMTGQYKGNSGVYLHGCYELQVLDSYGIEPPQANDCGAIYLMYPPRVNACKPALEWQTYDIFLRAPRFAEDGSVTESARVTIVQNGVCIHNNVELYRVTPGGVVAHPVAEGPLMLQDHNDAVSFRNVWIEKL